MGQVAIQSSTHLFKEENLTKAATAIHFRHQPYLQLHIHTHLSPSHSSSRLVDCHQLVF